MAVIDDKRGQLVVRIVYDGPAFSGKTSSVRALARGVGRTMTTPFEKRGRTLFFDWVDYVGGLFEGRQIRCQIVSAPGQRELSHRRAALLEEADAVVAVLDSRRPEWSFSLDWLDRVVAWGRSRDPSVGVVAQVNKRDAADAVALDEVRIALEYSARVPFVESTATGNEGIREAFVTAVRLALERVRHMASARRLIAKAPTVDTADELLAQLQEDEALSREARFVPSVRHEFGHSLAGFPASGSAPDAGAQPPEFERGDSSADAPPFIPDPFLPGGRVWPPIDGRALLAELTHLRVAIRRTTHSDQSGSDSGFRFHSSRDALFDDPAKAREALIGWARDHAANQALLSPGRAIVLADSGVNQLRLWQIVRSEATLREGLASAVSDDTSDEVAKELLLVAQRLMRARARFGEATVSLPCTLWTVGAGVGEPTFVGLMPPASGREPEISGAPLLERELGSQLRDLRRSRVDYQEIRAHIVALGGDGGPEANALAQIMPDA